MQLHEIFPTVPYLSQSALRSDFTSKKLSKINDCVWDWFGPSHHKWPRTEKTKGFEDLETV